MTCTLKSTDPDNDCCPKCGASIADITGATAMAAEQFGRQAARVDYEAAFKAEHKAIDQIWRIVDPQTDTDVTVRADTIVEMVRKLKADNEQMRERCTKIAQDEADEYERQRVEFVAPGGKHEAGGYEELGWQIHTSRSVASNIAALIRADARS